MAHKLAEDSFKRRRPVKIPQKTLVISKDSLNRLISHSHFLQANKDDCKIEEKRKQRKVCKELSEALSKKTKAGHELVKRQYAKEVERVRRDFNREAKKKMQNNDVLDKAYERLYKETDRVKYFKAAKEFCEVLKQRNDQIAAKASLQDQLADYDAQFLLGLLRDVDRYNDEEREKEKIMEDNKKKNAANWTKQHNEVLRKRNLENRENLRDRFHIEDEFEKQEQNETQKAEKEKENIQKYKTSLDEQIKDKLLLLDMRQVLDDADEERAKLFIEAKREMELEHKKIRSELNKKVTGRKQHVADNMIDATPALKARERDKLERAIQEADAKAKEENTKRAIKQAETRDAIEGFYRKEMALKQKKKYEDKLMCFRDKRTVDDLVEKLQVVEDAKQQKQQQLSSEAQHIQLHQIETRKVEKNSDKLDDLQQYLYHIRGLEDEEEIFQKYAQKEIEDCEKRGVNTYAMKKAARPGVECGKGPLFKNRGQIRPRYYAGTGNPGDLSHMKRTTDKPDTKRRLGFIL